MFSFAAYPNQALNGYRHFLSESWTLIRRAHSLTVPCSHLQDCGPPTRKRGGGEEGRRGGGEDSHFDKRRNNSNSCQIFFWGGAFGESSPLQYLLKEINFITLNDSVIPIFCLQRCFVALKLGIQPEATCKKFKNRAQVPIHLVLFPKMRVVRGPVLSFWLCSTSALVKLG